MGKATEIHCLGLHCAQDFELGPTSRSDLGVSMILGRKDGFQRDVHHYLIDFNLDFNRCSMISMAFVLYVLSDVLSCYGS